MYGPEYDSAKPNATTRVPCPESSWQVVDLHDLLDLDEATLPEARPEPLWDRKRVPKSHLLGSRKGSGTYWARIHIWQSRCDLMNSNPDDWNASDHRVLLTILDACQEGGTDRWTVTQRDLSRWTHTPRRTLRDVLDRLVAGTWLVIETHGKPGKGGSGQAAIIRITGRGVPPLPRRRGGGVEGPGKDLGGRALPAQKTCPPTKESTIPSTSGSMGTMVSGRGSDGVGTFDSRAGDRGDPAVGTFDSRAGDRGDPAVGTFDSRPSNQAKGAALDEWLRTRLVEPAQATQVIAEAVRAGFSRRAVFRSRDRLGVVTQDVSFPGDGHGRPPLHAVLWSLP